MTRYHKFTDLPACSEPKERDCTIPGTRKAIALGTRQASAHCAAALQRRPMQTPQQKTLRRALQGNPEACDHSEIAGRNRPGLPPEASWLPRSGTIVGPHRRTATPTRPAPPRPAAAPEPPPLAQLAARPDARGDSQIVNLHYILSKSSVKARPSVLWCYKKELELSRCAHTATARPCAATVD